MTRGTRKPRQRPDSIDRARELRRNETEAERRLWRAIRDRQLSGAKFRRQVPLASYVADLACFESRLIIEIDGGQHADHRAYDEQRSRTLIAQGYRVLRFWNNEIMENLDGVLETIQTALKKET